MTLVDDFYNSDLISRMCPGRKDNRKFVNENGEKERRQLRYMNTTVREAHELFKEQYPDHKVGLSKENFKSFVPFM